MQSVNVTILNTASLLELPAILITQRTKYTIPDTFFILTIFSHIFDEVFFTICRSYQYFDAISRGKSDKFSRYLRIEYQFCDNAKCISLYLIESSCSCSCNSCRNDDS